MRSDDELLAAYCDGVSELSAEERRHVEALLAGSPEARDDEAATRALLGALRELPTEGTEPDWVAMERSISAAVGPRAPRSWWRASWRWLVPVAALATAGAVIALWLARGPVASVETPSPIAITPARDAASPARPLAASDESVPLWLDGTAVEVDLDADQLLGAGDETTPDDYEIGDLLPTANLATVDAMSDDEIARLEQWLAEPAHVTPTGRKKG